MKILFVANRMPYPPFRGDKLKIYNLISNIIDEHEIHLITIAENQEDIDSIPPLLEPLGKSDKVLSGLHYIYRPKWKSALYTLMGIFSKKPFQVAFFKSPLFQKELDALLEKEQFDVIHVQHIRMAQYFVHLPKDNVILDLPDAFSLYWKRRSEKKGSIFNRYFAKMEFKRLFAFEKQIIPQFPISLVCSQEDQQYLLDSTKGNVHLLPNGVNINTFAPQQIPFVKGRVLFTGNMDYAPNIDAVSYFVNEIWPIILQKCPNSEFIIAGQRPVPKVLSLASKSVKVTGFIENLADEYAKAHVVVSPLRIGAGTQNKVLEALSMNIPVVCTRVGYAGLKLKPNQGALVSDSSQEFANNVIQLLEDESLRNLVGSTGGEHIRATFSWNGISKMLVNYFQEVKR